MGNQVTEAAVTVVGLIVGIAALSVLLSPNSTTAKVIQASASGLSNSIATAISPVTGSHISADLSYPSSGGLGSLALPSFH